MEFLNKVEIKGVVGQVRNVKVAGKKITRFSLMTETSTRENGTPTIETMWFNCTTHNEIVIKKGDYAHVIGRLRIRKYCDQYGEQIAINEVVVDSVTI